MGLYAGIDLHANNSYLAVIDETDELVVAKRYRNDLGLICKALEPHRDELQGIAVESTFNSRRPDRPGNCRSSWPADR